MGRNQGRVDDNAETIKKRFMDFQQQSMAMIRHYARLGKVHEINANRPVDEVYAEFRRCISQLGYIGDQR